MLLVGLGSSIVTIDKSTGAPSGQLVVPAAGDANYNVVLNASGSVTVALKDSRGATFTPQL